jgi:zinc protease
VFGAWRGAAPPPAPPPAPVPVPAVRGVVIVDRPDLVQTQIGFGHEGISRSDPERFAAMLTNTVLGGGGFSSRLMKTVRSDAGLTYSIGSGFASRREGGPFIVSTFTRVAEARRVVDLVLAELERIRHEPPTEAELADAKTQTVGGFALGLETSAAIAGSLVSLDVQGLPRDSLDVFRGRIRSLSTDDAATAARGRIHPDRVAIVLVGPAAELQPQMAGLGAIEIVKP